MALQKNFYNLFSFKYKHLIGIYFLLSIFFSVGAENRIFVFPKDHSFHAEHKVEWCYFVGILRSTEGKQYGFELSFFKGVFDKNREAFPVHFAISDLENKTHTISQTVERKLGGMAGYDSKQIFSGDFILKIEGKSSFRLIAKPKHSPELSLDLVLNAKDSDILLHGNKGKSVKSRIDPNFYSYYYSIPRLSTRGELTLNGKKIQIESGNSWMDHEWSSPFDSNLKTALSDPSNSWDWVCIQLEDGSDIMVFNFRKTIHSNSESFGTIRLSSGKKTYFEQESEVRFVPNSYFWISPRTNQKYPLVWNLSTRVASQKDSELNLIIEPFFEDQEFDSRSTTGFSYWEGAVKVKGTRAGKSVQGTGYLELKGSRDLN
ncbi:hydroxyneurosporene synthase CrtC [Leptospira noguchii str. 1993005606]|uniref:Hydroxyneurosporene synthase CrtC n=1 Tax=Leptospira noguchii str. 2007001578 TaxID=1049974 RepID=A0ABN0J6F0_9LEPT|nr:carotenoid 1,2-hydratase [Leptospira noguchii]EMN02608.1 hydroxyneurosporene synthase CrtC [Leptospira noguchii str. 2007001578]EPE86296.1 hydroxyneurosporene synthase CrtC [Leptospira noguchii str. 1993005606]